MAQPAAGTALPSTSLTSGIVWSRNEADTTASTQTAGSLTYTAADGFTGAWGTDADGRYKQQTSGIYGSEQWSGITLGAERTFLVVAKYASNGGDNQALIDCDGNPPRKWQFNIGAGGVADTIVFDSTPSVIGYASGPAVSSSAAVPVLMRIRNDAGTYKVRVDVAGTAGTEVALSGTPGTLSSGYFATGNRIAGACPLNNSKVYGETIWNRALSDVEMAAVGADAWAIYAAGSGATATLTTTLDASVFSGIASVSPLTVLTATMADAVFSGSAGSSGIASLSVSTDEAVFSGSASVAGSGTLTLPALKNNTGTVLASETGATAYIYATSGAHVVTKTGQTTNGSGVMTITDAALTAATQYRVVIVLASGAEGMDKVTAA